MAKKAKGSAKAGPAKGKAAAKKQAPKAKPAAKPQPAPKAKSAAPPPAPPPPAKAAARKPAGNVKPIPEGLAPVTPHLVVRGTALAIEFYKKAFGAVEVPERRWPARDGYSILHAEIKINGCTIKLCDETSDTTAKAPPTLGGTSGSIYLYVDNADAVWKQALDAGASVRVPIHDTWWGDRWGKIVDPFGHEWGIGTHLEELNREELQERANESYYAQIS